MSAGREEPAKHDGEGEGASERPLLEQWARIGEDYVVNKLIGRGGQSQIYEGYDTRNERLVAIKVFLFKHQLNASMLKRAKAEAKAEMRIAHPNIVKVYAAGVSEIQGPDGRKRELFYSVMEFLEGETLEDRIYRKGPLDLREALWILAEAADGLAMLHAGRIIHRDIKPENIFLAKPLEENGETRVVLIDLGIAKLDPKEFSVQRTDANILLGTFAYMSPEQIHHRCGVDGRADLYALGIVAWKSLVGVHPAWNHHAQPNPPPAEEYAAWHMTVEPPLVSSIRRDVPARVAALVARLLAKEPDARYRDAETAALEAVADLRERIAEVEAAPPPPVPQRRWGGVGVATPSEVWRPLGQATTQEDEGNEGPTTAGLVTVRARGEAVKAPVSPALPASPAVPGSAPPEPEFVTPARAPLRTGAGTEILEVTGGFAQEAPPRRPAPSAPALAGDVERTRTGTEIVPRQRLASLGLESTPLDLSRMHVAAVAPPKPALVAELGREPVTQIEAPGGLRGSSLPFGGATEVRSERPAPPLNATTEPRTTSGHLLTLAPSAPRVRSVRVVWAIAALAGVLCGLLFLGLRSLKTHAAPTADADPITVATPELDAGVADAAPAIAELPDAEAPDGEPSRTGAEKIPDAGDAKPARPSGAGAPPGQRVCDFVRGGCADAAWCADDPDHPRCNHALATAAQRAGLAALRDPPKPATPPAPTAPPAPSVAPSPSPASTRPKLPSNMAPQPLPPHDRIKD